MGAIPRTRMASPSPYGGLLTVDTLHCHRDFVTGKMHHFLVDERKCASPHRLLVDANGYARPPTNDYVLPTRPSNADNPTTRELKLREYKSIGNLVAATAELPYYNDTLRPVTRERTCSKTFAELKREKELRGGMWSPSSRRVRSTTPSSRMNPHLSWKIPDRCGLLNTPPLKIPALRPYLSYNPKTWGPKAGELL